MDQNLRKEIIRRGHLSINLPVFIVVMLVVTIINTFQLPWVVGVIGGALIGYIVWGKLIINWRNWAFSKGIEEDELIAISREGRVSFFSREIFEKILHND